MRFVQREELKSAFLYFTCCWITYEYSQFTIRRTPWDRHWVSDREKSVLQRVRHSTPPLPQKSPSFLFVAQARQKLRRVGSEVIMTPVHCKRGDCNNKKQLHYHWISLFHYWGSKGGAVVRALASHQYCPSSNPGVDAICGLSFVVGFLPCYERFILRVLRFSPPLKNRHFQIPIRPGIR